MNYSEESYSEQNQPERRERNASRHERSDAELSALLDEALAPPAPPVDLEHRIVASARIASARVTPTHAIAQRQWSWRATGVTSLAAAAAIALALVGAWALLGAPEAQAPTNTPAIATHEPTLEQALGALNEAAAAGELTSFDQQIEMVGLEIEMTHTDPAWPGTGDPLNEAAARVQTHRVAMGAPWMQE